MSLSPSMDGAGKKTMQTTVAILEDDPHRFKIRPLKQVPVDKRPVSTTPSLNFDRDRPYVGCRLELPSMYQLAPSRSVSTQSFNSITSECGTIQTSSLEIPSPAQSFEISDFKDTGTTGLGFHNVDAGNFLVTATQHSSFDSQISSASLSLSSRSQPSKSNFSSSTTGPDLTFAATDDSSGPSRLNTPATVSDVTSSFSSDSFRKAKSMMVFDSLPRASLSQHSISEEVPPSGSSGSLRRLRAKTLSVSTSEKGRLYRRKRHAVYGGQGMQFAFPPNADDHSFSVTPSTPEFGSDSSSASLEPSPCILAVERKNAANQVLTKSSLPPSKRTLDFVDPNEAVGSFLSVPIGHSTASRASFVRPLNIVRTHSKQRFQRLLKPSRQENVGHAPIHRHPIIEDLLQELDLAISEWRVISYL